MPDKKIFDELARYKQELKDFEVNPFVKFELQSENVKTVRGMFKAAPGITCVQVIAQESVALSCVKE